MTYASELPTLRLTTLRSLTRHSSPLAVVHVSTPLADLAPMLADQRVWVVAVDDGGQLCGVLSHADAIHALRREPDGWVADYMARSSIALPAETDIGEACAALDAVGADHILVHSANGELLGVVIAAVLASYRQAA